MQGASKALWTLALIIFTVAVIIALIIWLALQELQIAVTTLVAFLLVVLTVEITIYLKLRKESGGRA